jgi:hypothetical protein
MPQPMSRWQNLQELRARTQEPRQDASLAWLMPGANHLTRAITAAILDARGLRDERPGPQSGRTHATVLFAQAATLSHEVEILCTQARALCREAEILRKTRPAPTSWRRAAGAKGSSWSSTAGVCRGTYIRRAFIRSALVRRSYHGRAAERKVQPTPEEIT